MSDILMGWANIWILDGFGPSPSPVLAFVGTRDLVFDILSLVLLTYCILSIIVVAWAAMFCLTSH